MKFELKKPGLGIIILAALLLESISVMQYTYTRSLLKEELQKRMEIELAAKTGIIMNTLESAETTMQERLGDMQAHLNRPDSLFSVTKRLIKANRHVVGGCMAFLPDYYPEKGRFFEPYASKDGSGRIRVEQLGGEDHDYTLHPAYGEVLRSGKSIWSDPYFVEADSVVRLTTYSYPLRDKSGEIAAVCGLDINLSWLGDTLNTNLFYPSSFGLLLTRSGKIVGGPGRKRSSLEGLHEISRLLKESDSEMIVFRDGKTRKRAFIHRAALPKDPEWDIALVNYYDEVFQPINRMRLWGLLMTLTGLLLLGFIINRYARNARKLHTAEVQQARIGSELQVARDLQMQFLPKTFPERKDIDIYGSLVPAREVGGDLFDCFFREDGRLVFCIGDVSGKGVPSALIMAMIHSLFRMVSAREDDPARIMQALNEEACRNNEANMFVTFFLGIFDPGNGLLRYCNAGHDNPVLIGRTAGKLPVKANFPIGVFTDSVYEGEECTLTPGTTVFLYTDGVTEARNPRREQFTMDRILEILGKVAGNPSLTARKVLETMDAEISNFVENAQQSDDLTMLAVRYVEVGEPVLNEKLTLKNDIKQIAGLGNFIKDLATRIPLPDTQARKLRLAAEEIVVNVMNYAYPPGEEGEVAVEAASDGKNLEITVSDTGLPFDPTAKPDADTTLSVEDREVGGLGIHLARQMADRIRYERRGDRNILTLTMNIQPS